MVASKVNISWWRRFAHLKKIIKFDVLGFIYPLKQQQVAILSTIIWLAVRIGSDKTGPTIDATKIYDVGFTSHQCTNGMTNLWHIVTLVPHFLFLHTDCNKCLLHRWMKFNLALCGGRNKMNVKVRVDNGGNGGKIPLTEDDVIILHS